MSDIFKMLLGAGFDERAPLGLLLGGGGGLRDLFGAGALGEGGVFGALGAKPKGDKQLMQSEDVAEAEQRRQNPDFYGGESAFEDEAEEDYDPFTGAAELPLREELARRADGMRERRDRDQDRQGLRLNPSSRRALTYRRSF